MPNSPFPHRRRHKSTVTGALLLSAALSLTACGRQHVAADAPNPPGAPGHPTTAGPTATPTPTSTPTPSGTGPYVEPGSHDGAPHYGDNNAFRRPREMSPGGEEDARLEAARIEPVLKRLWQQRKWDPASVRAALVGLGYEEERTGPKGERSGGNLAVRGMEPRFEGDHYVTPEGTRIGLRVHPDACVTAFVQKTNYQVQTNGPYLESGCFEPPFGH
ncbi:hypothetical protein [Streptomyces sp. CB02959]|uniref:hypothetical protein n=1 Tax=Streptomyces sp. CB02959 TaxID=2020330 RepID=UPI0015E13F24|nr:hypothetical protein [Streptomyces sp. CB02959]